MQTGNRRIVKCRQLIAGQLNADS